MQGFHSYALLKTGNTGHTLRSRLYAGASSTPLVLASALMVSAMSMGATSANAQELAQAAAVPAPPEEIVVTGIRNSLQKDLDIKRSANGLVDAISATDIGQFPDSDLAEAMQRIPGVTVTKGQPMIGGTSSNGDATGITVRGFGPQFNDTLFNGRQVATTNGRAVDFSSLGADFVRELDVMKSPDASLSSGSIGATVNVIMPNPLDKPGMVFAGQAGGTVASWEGATPNGNFLFSDTFAHDTIGILFGAGYSDLRTNMHHVENRGFSGTLTSANLPDQYAPGSNTSGIGTWHTIDYDFYNETEQERRELGRISLQWRPVPSLTFTIDDNFSRDDQEQRTYGVSWWFNNPTAQLGNMVRDSNGTVTSFNNVYNFGNPPAALYDQPTDFDSGIAHDVVQTNDVGFNLKWKQTDKLTATLDIDKSISWLNPNTSGAAFDKGDTNADIGYGPSVNPGTNGIPVTSPGNNGNSAGVVIPGGSNVLPYPINYGPNGVASQLNNPNIFGTHVMTIFNNRNMDAIGQLKFTETYSDDDTVVKLGAQYVDDNFGAKEYCDLFCGSNNLWQTYSGYGPNSGSPNGLNVPASLLGGHFSTSNFIPGMQGNNNLPPSVLQFNAQAIYNYMQSFGNPHTHSVPGYVASSAPTYQGVFYGSFSPGNYGHTHEDTASVFLTYQKETKVADMPLRVNLGLREDLTRVKTLGLGQEPSSITVSAADHTAFNINFGPSGNVYQSNSYQYFVPNLDFALEVTPDLNLRFDASRTKTDPPLNQLNPTTNFGGRVGGLTENGGNPQLLPYLSDNFDLSAEYYYAKNSYVSIDGFVKDVSQFPVGSAKAVTIPGLLDPTTGTNAVATFSSQFNGPSAWVWGGEFQVQHAFGDSGFGFTANATVVGTNKPYDPNNLTVNNFAVPGLADSATLVAFYDKNGLQARVAYTWRADQLQGFGQNQGGSAAFGAEPVYEESTSQVDFTSSYAITKQLSVFFSALNLTDAEFIEHGRYTNQLLTAVDFGRQYKLGVHFKY